MNLTTANEAELLGLMATQIAAPEQARAAWGELFVRHRRYVFAVVSRSFGRYLGDEGTTDIVIDTFRRAFEWAGRQPNRSTLVDRFSGESSDATRRKVLGWLGAIAERLFKDRFREDAARTEEFDLFLEHWRTGYEHPIGSDTQLPPALLEQALATLSAGDAEALRLSLPWYDLETGCFAVPRGEASRVAALLGTNPEALRQRRHRALQKLREHFHEAGCALYGEEELS